MTMTVVQEEKQPITLEDALAAGQARLASMKIDMSTLGSLTLAKFEAIRDFQSDATVHFYQKTGYSAADAADLFGLVKRFLALSVAWRELGHPGFLSLPDRLDIDGWHGFIIQTRDYRSAGELLGRFVHHSTTDGPQGDHVTITMAILFSIFGEFAPQIWADCPDCIVHGWCSDCDDR
jgi:hypothetical protein